MSQPTIVRPVWTPADAQQAARDAREHTAVPAEPCQCESLDCTHAYLSVPAGHRRAWFIGGICDDCADTHMRPYLREGGVV